MSTTTSQNRLKNCIQDSMALNNGFMPIKSLQKQPKRSLRRSKTPPRFLYDVPRRPKTPPRRSQERPRGLQDTSKTPPRRLQEAPKTPLRSSQEPVTKRTDGVPLFWSPRVRSGTLFLVAKTRGGTPFFDDFGLFFG